MDQLFRSDDTPTQVIGRIRQASHPGWEDLDPWTRSLGVKKLRLAGVYDDRQDGHFMLRTRIPGGRLTADQLEVVAGVTAEFARRPDSEEGPDRFAEITTRQDLQIHWIRLEVLAEIWARYERVGLTSAQACGDTLRNVTACAVDGLDARAHLDVQPVVGALSKLAADNQGLTSFLPRKFKVAVTGCPTDCVLARIHDLAFTPARRDGQIGFNVHVGGGLSDSPRLATALNLFVSPTGVVDVVRAALELYAVRGDPQHKAVNRFRILVHELGPETILAEIAGRLPFPSAPAGEDLSTWASEDHLGVHRDRNGRHHVGLCVPLGRLGADDLTELARLARDYGDRGIRLTQRQNVILTGVAEIEALLTEPLLARLRPAPDPFERAVVACTSAPFCKFAILNVKEYGAELIDHLRGTVPHEVWARLDGLRLHLSGCKASCAQVQAAHIGLRATMARHEDGYRDAFDIALGGDVGARRLGRWAELEVPAATAFERIAAALAGPDGLPLIRTEEARR